MFWYLIVIHHQARSQDLEKGGGLFWKSEKCAYDLDSNFHWPWLEFHTICPKFEMKCLGKIGNSKFFPPKIRWSPKKKKKKKKKIQSDFSAEIQNSNVFSAQNQVISKKKKKKKKRSSPKFRAIFLPISQVQTYEGGLFSYGGGYFPFFTENRPQKNKKHAILHTSQANGGGSSPPAPPLATLLFITIRINYIWFDKPQTESSIPYILADRSQLFSHIFKKKIRVRPIRATYLESFRLLQVQYLIFRLISRFSGPTFLT